MPFAELSATSNFTFLTGASHPEELAARAAELRLEAIAIADRNSVAGVVRAFSALKEMGRAQEEGEAPVLAMRETSNLGYEDVVARAEALQVQPRNKSSRRDPHDDSPARWAYKAAESPPQSALNKDGPTRPDPPAPPPPVQGPLPRLIPAARLAPTDGLEITALPTDRPAWGRLCRLLTIGKRRTEKGQCLIHKADIADWAEGMILLIHPPDPLTATAPEKRQARDEIAEWVRRFPEHVFLAAAPRYDGRDQERLTRLTTLAEATGARLTATAEPLMHIGRRKALADVLTCIRQGVTIDRIGKGALVNSERRLRPESEMRRLFSDCEDAVDRAAEVARRCRFRLDELKYEYPDEVAAGEDPQARLERLTREGLTERYPDGVPPKVEKLARHELALIGKLDYARYFLTVRDVVAFAEDRGILCQGRGSAANSVVCYALRVTAIGPEIASMVFERFVSEARDEPPDIDVDFEHERREEVIQHIYERYGRHRAGLCATVIHYRARRAIREVGKAMGLSADAVSALASQIWGWSSESVRADRIREVGLDPDDPRLALTLTLVDEIIGFPRHLSQHVGGFIINRGRLDELCPIENAAMEDRTVIEWDKDDIDALGILKVDVLSLGMLTCIRKAFDLIEHHHGARYSLATLPPEDPAVYDMLCDADSVGVFQVESRAQMNFLPRMRPRKFYDLVIEVAIVRPGPIQGDMVHPYLRRRRGEEQVTFPSDELGEVLGKTLGVPLFQEQAMQIAIVGAGFSPLEADRLRRALATFRKSGTIHTFRERFVGGMLAKGYEQDFAERCFSQIEGFGEYGFPESHAASFALLVYASAWIKKHHPGIFACALLNAQPMGFYAPAQIVRDARQHGVEVRPVCVNASFWDNVMEPDGMGGLALRLGFRQIKGMKEEEARWISAARGNGYREVEDVWRKAGASPRALTLLAEADAFHDLGLSRRDALWRAKAVNGDQPPPLFADLLEGEGIQEPAITLPPMTEGEEVVEDYVSMRLTLRAHPVALLRKRLTAADQPGPFPRPPSALPCARLSEPPNGARVTVAGLVIVRQRPGSAKGVIFVTLEDETGIANIVIWAKIYERFRRQVIAARLMRVTGRIQREGQVIHVVADLVEDISPLLDELTHSDRKLNGAEAHADEVYRPVPEGREPGGHRARARHPREQAKALFPERPE